LSGHTSTRAGWVGRSLLTWSGFHTHTIHIDTLTLLVVMLLDNPGLIPGESRRRLEHLASSWLIEMPSIQVWRTLSSRLPLTYWQVRFRLHMVRRCGCIPARFISIYVAIHILLLSCRSFFIAPTLFASSVTYDWELQVIYDLLAGSNLQTPADWPCDFWFTLTWSVGVLCRDAYLR